jgi:phosphoribosyl 1,2-cyclic phosphate phosphodiesterase
VRVVELADGDTVEIGGVTIRPIRLAEDYAYAFELTGDGRRVLIAMDETFGWQPPAALRGADLAVLPMGFVEHDPFTGERRVAADFPALRSESRLADTLAIAAALDARRTIFTHVEEPFGLTHDDLVRLAARLGTEGHRVEFAWDTLVVDP